MTYVKRSIETFFQIIGDPTQIPKKSQIIKNTQHPTYEEGFTFLIGEAWEECEAHIEVFEASTGRITCQYSFAEGCYISKIKTPRNIDIFYIFVGGTFGTIKLQLQDIAEQPIRREIRPILDEKPVQTITFSANLKFA